MPSFAYLKSYFIEWILPWLYAVLVLLTIGGNIITNFTTYSWLTSQNYTLFQTIILIFTLILASYKVAGGKVQILSIIGILIVLSAINYFIQLKTIAIICSLALLVAIIITIIVQIFKYQYYGYSFVKT